MSKISKTEVKTFETVRNFQNQIDSLVNEHSNLNNSNSEISDFEEFENRLTKEISQLKNLINISRNFQHEINTVRKMLQKKSVLFVFN